MTKQPKTDGSDSLFTSVVAVVRELGLVDENDDWLNEKSSKELEDERQQKHHLMPALNVVDGTAILDDTTAKKDAIEKTIFGLTEKQK